MQTEYVKSDIEYAGKSLKETLIPEVIPLASFFVIDIPPVLADLEMLIFRSVIYT